MSRAIDGTWSRFVWNLGESESLARKFRDGKACLIDLRLAVEAQPTLTQPNEWVSVEDAMPPELKMVLVYSGGLYDVAGWVRDEAGEVCWTCSLTPEFWRPIPELDG